MILEHKNNSYQLVPEIDSTHRCEGCIANGPTDEDYDLCATLSRKCDNGIFIKILSSEKPKQDLSYKPMIPTEEQTPGTKYDNGKLQYTLIPPYALEAAARNLTVGLQKYKERDNWKKVPDAEQRYMDALYRHLEAIRKGEIYDKESGAENMPHMAAVVVNAMFLLEFMLNPELKGTK